MAGENHPLVQLARRTIEQYVREGKVLEPPDDPTPEMQQCAGVFVSLHRGEMLRGCIGTFQPVCQSVAEEIINNAISAAVHDPRFPPLQPSELKDLDVSVDVLSPPERVSSMAELDPRRYGVIVQAGFRRGLLLPDLEGVDTVELQVDIARQKAGISPHEPVDLYRFEVKRYTNAG